MHNCAKWWNSNDFIENETWKLSGVEVTYTICCLYEGTRVQEPKASSEEKREEEVREWVKKKLERGDFRWVMKLDYRVGI